MMKKSAPLVIATLILLMSGTPSLADQIDGEWCSPTGASMTFNVGQVTTPTGKTVVGNHTRHHFDYVAPAGDNHAGALISADQINDDAIRVTVTDNNSAALVEPEIWTKCAVLS